MLEVLSLRTENSKTFDLGNGQRRLDAHIGAIHYKDNYSDKSEQWKDIDLRWEGNRITKAPYELTLEGNKVTIRDKKSGEVSTIELLEIGGESVSLTTQKDVAPDTDLEIVAGNNSIRITRVLKSEKAPVSAKFKVTGNWAVHAKDATEGIENELPVESILVDGVLTETLKPNRPIKYPVRIDPTLSIQPPGKDNKLHLSFPTTNKGSDVNLAVEGTAIYLLRSLLEFSLAGLPVGAVLSAADLMLYWLSDIINSPVGRTYWAYRLTRTDWVELESCWSYYKGTTGWTAAGGDYTTDDGASVVIPADYGWITWDVLDQVLYAQTEEIAAEFLIRDNVETETTRYGGIFHSNDYTDDTDLCPKLVVTYIPAIPVADGDLIGIGIIRKS